MNIQRYTESRLYRSTFVIACQVSLTVLLSACGNGSEQLSATPAGATPVSTSGNQSVSAAQLADGSTTTLSIAQATQAGLVPVQIQNIVNAEEANNENTVEPPVIGAAVSAEQAIDPAQSTEPTVTPQPTSEAESTPIPVVRPEPAIDSESEVLPVAQVEAVSEPATTTQTQAAVEQEQKPEAAPETEAAIESEPDAGVNTEVVAEPAPQASPTPEALEPVVEHQTSVSSGQTKFVSNNTEGFEGEVLDDGVVKVTWQKDPTARGYNFYRAGEFVDTVLDEEYLDEDTYDESYYYEVQAFDYEDNFNYIARGLTVEVSGTGRTNPDSPKPKDNILDGYELVFSDEFNGSELDSSKWVTQYLWGDQLVINSEEQHYVDIQNKPDFGFNPFSFDGESVTISSIPTPDNLKEKAFGQKYLSGVMTSYDAFKFTYGYVETRAQLPYGRGLWPAFWLLNAYYVDDKPEIDIMEFIGDNQDTVYHTYHYYDNDGNLRSTDSEGTRGTDWTNGWHTYAVEWLPGLLIFYVDGIEQHRVIDSKVSQQEMYILANTALGGWWPGSPDETTKFPAEYKIDYIRAYQKADGVLLSDPNADQPSQLLLWDDVSNVSNVSPNHIPPFELWPAGYPERQGR